MEEGNLNGEGMSRLQAPGPSLGVWNQKDISGYRSRSGQVHGDGARERTATFLSNLIYGNHVSG